MDRNDLSPDLVKRELSDVLKIATDGDKQHIIANRENSERLKTDSSISGSANAETGVSVLGIFSGSVMASALFALANRRDWGQSSKSVDDQLRELNNHSENHIKWEREGLKIVPKSLNVARISKATLTRNMTINRVRKRFVDAKFKRSYDIYVDESPATATALCDESWHHYNGSCYKHFRFAMNWTAAKSHCESHAAHLATIGDRKENEFVTNINSDREHTTFLWIGLRKDQENQFAWIDTTHYSFVNWADGQPSDEADCVWVSPVTKKWYNNYCRNKDHFVCEKEL